MTYTDPNLHFVLTSSRPFCRVWNERVAVLRGQIRKRLESVSLRLLDRTCSPFPFPHRDSSRNSSGPFCMPAPHYPNLKGISFCPSLAFACRSKIEGRRGRPPQSAFNKRKPK